MALSLARNQALSMCLPAASHLSLLLLRALHRHAAPVAGAATRAPAHSAVSSSLPQQPSQQQARSAHSGASGIPPIPTFWSPSAESTTDSAALSALDSALLGNSSGAASPIAWPSHSAAHEKLLDSISHQLDAARHAATTAEPLNHPAQTAHLPENEAVDSVLRMFVTPKPSPLTQSWDADSLPCDATLAALPGMPEQGWRASWRDENVTATRAGESPRGQVHDTPLPDIFAADSGSSYGLSEKARALPFVSITPGVVFELDD